MNPNDTSNLLRYCGSVDRWLNAPSPDEAALMVAGWTDLLAHVPLDFALRTARTHYARPDARTIQPGDIVGAWQAHAAELAARAEEAEARALAAAGHDSVLVPTSGASTYLRDLATAHTAGRDLATVPRPAGVRVLTPEQDRRSRRCTYHALCACLHEKCRRGWLVEPVQVINDLGRPYEAVAPCPHCRDALLMAEERGIAKKPHRGAPARR